MLSAVISNSVHLDLSAGPDRLGRYSDHCHGRPDGTGLEQRRRPDRSCLPDRPKRSRYGQYSGRRDSVRPGGQGGVDFPPARCRGTEYRPWPVGARRQHILLLQFGGRHRRAVSLNGRWRRGDGAGAQECRRYPRYDYGFGFGCPIWRKRGAILPA